jgi:transposase-like protein
MMHERGLSVHHSTLFRWVQVYAPEINKRIKPHLKMSGTSYRIDETYIKVGKNCKYLYRAVDKEGQTVEFMLSAKRDVCSAKRFFKKMMRADHHRLPFSISVDKNGSYPEAFTSSQDEQIVLRDCTLRRVKYLNNVIEQDHQSIKKKVQASQCFKSFHTAERTLEGIEAMNMMRKGLVKRLSGDDAQGQARVRPQATPHCCIEFDYSTPQLARNQSLQHNRILGTGWSRQGCRQVQARTVALVRNITCP